MIKHSEQDNLQEEGFIWANIFRGINLSPSQPESMATGRNIRRAHILELQTGEAE